MENVRQDEGYEKARQDAEKFYFRIKKIQCLALNDEVIFDERGFKHLVWKHAVPRHKGEQQRRFLLLRYVPDILNDASSVFSSDIKRIRNLKAQFWSVISNRDGMRVKVVIRQIGNGKKHFFSVYGRKQKSSF